MQEKGGVPVKSKQLWRILLALALLAAEKLTPQRVYVRTASGYEEMGG